jgi:hypothetical protein
LLWANLTGFWGGGLAANLNLLADPRCLEERESEVVTYQEISSIRAGEEGIVLVE